MSVLDRAFKRLRLGNRLRGPIECATDLRPWVEQRVQDATAEAKAFVDDGLHALSGAVRGVGNATRESLQMAEKSLRQAETMSEQLQEVRQEVFGTLGATRQEISDDYNAQLRNIERRLEFIRAEIMYELQAVAARTGGKANGNQTASRIVNTIKVDAARANLLKLNLGCGHVPFDGYVNVDSRELPGVDVVAEALDLPFESGEVDEIISSHLVEHFSAHILEAVVLPYWHSLLKPGGELVTVAPDGAAMLAGVQSGEMTFEDFREVLFGGQDYEGDFHFNLLTPATYSAALVKAGFADIEVIYERRRNGKCFEFRIVARKV